MRLVPRDYQQECADRAIDHMRKTDDPGVVVVTTAGGKSVITALVAQVVAKAGKRVLCLSPSGDLASESVKKYRAIGEQCSVFSASLNARHTGHQVVFGTPLTIVNSLDKFTDEYALLLIDECAGVSDDDETTYQRIISHLKSINPKLRILGLDAVPVRGKEKLIGKNNTFQHVIHELPHNVLCPLGWVVDYRLGFVHNHYSLAQIKVQSNGLFKQSEIDAETLGKERLSKSIVQDMMQIMDSEDRKCAIIFASSIKHAKEILSYLPEDESCLITGKTPKPERKERIEESRQGAWRYLVTVNALSVGTDIPIVDTVVFMRATASVRLLLQGMGRGCRLYDNNWTIAPGLMNRLHEQYTGKIDCLIMDFGENIERFSLDDDLVITGLVEAKGKQEEGEYFEVACPDCGTVNKHTAQRCVGTTVEGIRCDFRFIFKSCDECGAPNSPSARFCCKCDATLIDPDSKLTRTAAIAIGTPYQVAVIYMELKSHWKGESNTLRVDYKVTDGSKTFTISEFKKPGSYPWHRWTQAVSASGNTIENVILEAATLAVPTRLMVKRRKGSKYHEIVALYFDDVNMLDTA
jgi:DNA repair protein RadD